MQSFRENIYKGSDQTPVAQVVVPRGKAYSSHDQKVPQQESSAARVVNNLKMSNIFATAVG